MPEFVDQGQHADAHGGEDADLPGTRPGEHEEQPEQEPRIDPNRNAEESERGGHVPPNGTAVSLRAIGGPKGTATVSP